MFHIFLETWICTRHSCKVCSAVSTKYCSICPISYCTDHLTDNLVEGDDGQFCCNTHESKATPGASVPSENKKSSKGGRDSKSKKDVIDKPRHIRKACKDAEKPKRGGKSSVGSDLKPSRKSTSNVLKIKLTGFHKKKLTQ